eukprot:CAMPEP_0174322972 /NCGR_PEP_ID=MMETSP0810-20121108/11438_1 /TAXON_ID=73025 ORGANISM="Eutreptiella gymnastica-like, Strain CCMP1594" /NCGR_SAMPLE_ID=MMETSP0810 /ASSEMBLY_ACC=CAM_ASM_000659 /LENGTH=58 /DNA_ID=CAMNT_0015435127 /DNA_START=277 /DNA_END=453 /DNA_ORIENTATION=+
MILCLKVVHECMSVAEFYVGTEQPEGFRGSSVRIRVCLTPSWTNPLTPTTLHQPRAGD